MSGSALDKVFAGSIPKFYDEVLVPLIFAPYADDLARRVAARAPGRVLELAAGTGVATRAMRAVLPRSATLVATDLNQAMLDAAAAIGAPGPVEWRIADAMALPFDEASFDVVVCQFGVMFFPDKAKAFAETLRVLRPGGTFILNVWDRIEDNEFADAVTSALAVFFAADPPRFLARTPHGYHDRATIERDLRQGGFTSPAQVETIAARSKAATPRIPALAYCEGTPLRNEIVARDAARLAAAIDCAAEEVARRFGAGAVDGKIQAHVVAVER